MLSIRRPLLAVYMKLLYSGYRNKLCWTVTTASLCYFTADILLTNTDDVNAAC